MACDPNTLLADARCILACIPPAAMPAVEVSLLCQIAAAGGGSGSSSLVTAAAYGAGDGYTVEDTGATFVTFSVTNPFLTLAAAGTYRLRCRVRVDAVALTMAAQRTITFQLYQTTPGNVLIPNTSCAFIISPKTAADDTIEVLELPEVFFTVVAGNVIKILAVLDSLPDSGDVKITEAAITAIKVA